MKLTRRQEDFILNLIDLNRELDGPIHYSVLAERLGVSPFTAYDMLCVLEEKGMVSSEYQRAAGKSGPGRAERLFCPVLTAADRVARQVENISTADLDDAGLRQFVAEKIRRGDIPDRAAAETVLTRVEAEGSRVTGYCTSVMTIVALRLQERISQQKLTDYLPQLLQENSDSLRGNLTLLGGFIFGLLVHEDSSNQEWSQMLLEQVQRYQEFVIAMSDAEIVQLAEALKLLYAPPSAKVIGEMIPA